MSVFGNRAPMGPCVNCKFFSAFVALMSLALLRSLVLADILDARPWMGSESILGQRGVVYNSCVPIGL